MAEVGDVAGEADVVLAERRSDGVALVTLNRPKSNALSLSVLERLQAVLDELVADPPGALVLWGGRRIFCAGADIEELSRPGVAAKLAADLHGVADTLASFPRVTMAALSGFALGGGLELALACDLRVASSALKVGQPEIRLGIIPGGGATQRLPRLIGPSRAKDLVLTGRQVDAEEAFRMGLVDRVVLADAVLEESLRLAAELAAGPLVAQSMAKQAIDEGMEGPLPDGLRRELSLFSSVFDTEDAQAGVASFLQQGPGRARFSGR
jgi:enoyl-CoA hydratase/carnithine racemase